MSAALQYAPESQAELATRDVWLLHVRPADYPHCCVARRWTRFEGVSRATDNIITSPDLDELREILSERGLEVICPAGPGRDYIEVWG